MKKWMWVGAMALLGACDGGMGDADGAVPEDAMSAADASLDAGGSDPDAGPGRSDAGPGLDAGPFDAGAATDAGPLDAGTPPAVASVDWVVPARVWSGRDEPIRVTLLDAGGAPVDASATTVTIEIASGTSTGTISSSSDRGVGVFEFTFRGLLEGTAVRFDVRVGGALLGALSPELQVIVPLLHYEPAGPTVQFSEIRNNLSGHTWNPDSGRFVLIRNNDRMMHVLAPDLTHLSAISLGGIPIGGDLEDIVYLGGPADAPEYAIVDENGRAAIGVIPPGTTGSLSLRDWQTIRYAGNPAVGNKGGEGIAHDPATGRMWVCTERSPMIVYAFMRPPAGMDVSYDSGFVVTQPFDADARLGSTITDISSCLFDTRTQRLLILSQESSRLLDVDFDGTVIASYDVDGAPQFEGVTLIAARDMLLSSEPNRIRQYTYRGPTP